MIKKSTYPNKHSYLAAFLAAIISLGIFLTSTSFAIAQEEQEETEEEAMARMHRELNKEVMEKPFLAEKPKEVDAYIKSMLDKNVKPEEYGGKHWRTGYTCRDLLRYSWREYRNCRYYHRYHGRYYY